MPTVKLGPNSSPWLAQNPKNEFWSVAHLSTSFVAIVYNHLFPNEKRKYEFVYSTHVY